MPRYFFYFSRALKMSNLTVSNLSTARLGVGSDPHGHIAKEKLVFRKVVWIIVSAIIFVVIVALYEILKVAVNNYFHMKAVKHPDCQYTKVKADRLLATNHHNLISACVFGLLVLLTAAIVLPILFGWVSP
ncbi:Hypothetical protein POVR1_LOCUS211 [uncultured virus]|nr:Hypothetical protein POVR1_LOCUS211 [uncultured virus]